MTQVRTVIIALAGAACLGSVVSMAVPTRMAISTPTIGGHAAAGIAGDELAYYREPGPQDLDPAAYYPGDWSQAAPVRTDAGWLAAKASGYRTAGERDFPETVEPAEPEIGSEPVSASRDGSAPGSAAGQAPTVTILGGNTNGANDAAVPEHIAVIDVPAPQ